MTTKDVRAEIEAALKTLPVEANATWRKVDRHPYIHATDDTDAKPWQTPTVGRFDYMETADYILACSPPNIRQLLTQHDAALAAEREKLRVLRNAGAQLANCAFNLSQTAGKVLSERSAKTLKFAQVEWDSAVAATQGANHD